MRKKKGKGISNSFEASSHEIECEDLEPIRIVVRELERPDGTTVAVEVPVYPPFRLKQRKTRRAREENAA